VGVKSICRLANAGNTTGEGLVEHPLGVAAKIIISEAGRILLLQRSAADQFDSGLWELPGGKMDYGEALTAALAREVAEETGLTVAVGRPILTWHFQKDPFWITGVTFSGRRIAGDIMLSHEHDDYGWFRIPEALAMPLSTSMREQITAYAETDDER
jgi:8-oxo-dGTP diphosphatase